MMKHIREKKRLKLDGVLNVDVVIVLIIRNEIANKIGISRGEIMIEGRKVYDPVTNTWSAGYWIPVYDRFGHIVQYVPVWRD